MTDKQVYLEFLSAEENLIKIMENVTQFQKVKSDEEKKVQGESIIALLKQSTLSVEQIEEISNDFSLLKKVVSTLAKDVKKLEKKLKKQKGAETRKAQEESNLAEKLPKIEWNEVSKSSFGVLPMHQSAKTGYAPELTSLEKLSSELDGKDLIVRARVHTSRGVGKQCFLLLRFGVYSVQAIVSVDDNHSENLIAFCKSIPKESIIDIYGTVRKAPEAVESATIKDVELHINRAFIVSISEKPTPVNVQDCMLPEEKLKEMEGFGGVSQSTRLDYRYLDIRAPAHIAILKIQSAVGQLFREFLYSEGFTEIHTPKLIATASEGGANVFKLGYFGRDAFLAQSPQLYKQMAVQSDLMKVFEIGPVFRAENSNTHRHLCEFVGLDLEMSIENDYHEVLKTLDGLFVYIFENLTKRFSKELQIINEQYPFQPLKYRPAGQNLILKFPEAMQLLRDAGEDVGDYDDLTTPQEKLLGKIIKEKYDTDFYLLDKFPMNIRPFYTMPDPENPLYSNSYDLFIRGEEICSGAQRIHDSEFLLEKAKNKNVSLEPIMDYVNSFRYGGWPHGGAGIGLERVVMLFLGIPNVRRVTMFPRTPDRLTP